MRSKRCTPSHDGVHALLSSSQESSLDHVCPTELCLSLPWCRIALRCSYYWGCHGPHEVRRAEGRNFHQSRISQDHQTSTPAHLSHSCAGHWVDAKLEFPVRQLNSPSEEVSSLNGSSRIFCDRDTAACGFCSLICHLTFWNCLSTSVFMCLAIQFDDTQVENELGVESSLRACA